jgi:hypothetical protein
MDKIVLARDNGHDIRFAGERIAHVSSRDAPRPKAEKVDRWTDLEIYRTETNRYVAVRYGRTTRKGELEKITAEVFDTAADVILFFGHGWLSKQLYERAGFDAVVDV